MYGEFINALLAFMLVAAAVYFFVVIPINALIARTRKNAPLAEPTVKDCAECLSSIPVKAKKCAHCTSVVA